VIQASKLEATVMCYELTPDESTAIKPMRAWIMNALAGGPPT